MHRFKELRVIINGEPEISEGVYIGEFSEINAKGARVIINKDCDIASFVSINVADSSKRCIGLKNEIERGDIILENNVFVGSHVFIGKNTRIGNNSVIAAGTILHDAIVPPFSLVYGNPAIIRKGYYD